MAVQQNAHARGALVKALRAGLRGEVVDPAHADYDRIRRVWNGLIDRYPTAIARCVDVEDVVQAIRVAREQRPVLSIRGNGHQVAGSAVCDDGLVIARHFRVNTGGTMSKLTRNSSSRVGRQGIEP